jgi:hypothetical protein
MSSDWTLFFPPGARALTNRRNQRLYLSSRKPFPAFLLCVLRKLEERIESCPGYTEG